IQRALRRSLRWQGHENRRVQGRRFDERHRAAGSRVLRGDQGKARAEQQRGASAGVLSDFASARTAARTQRVTAERAMKQRRIGPFSVTAIGLGCMNLSHAYGAPPPQPASEALLLGAL